MSDPRPIQVASPGTDFIVFATGAGANVEDMPSYQSDPQRQTGNLPGIARSSFNNRVQRQGAFVGAAISTFVWEVLSIYVPDDGDLDNYVANFKAALRQYITPEGALPGGPYLPIAGGTMQGNIDFNSGATIVLAYNTWLRARDSGGTSHGLVKLGNGTDNNHYIGDGSAPFIIFGSTPVVGSGIFWGARDTGGTAHGLLGIYTDNNTYLNAFNNLYLNSANIWTNSSIIIPNNVWYYAKNNAAAPVAMLGVRSDNITLIAVGAPSDTYIYSGRNLVLVGPTAVTGTLTPQGNVGIGGTLNVGGGTTLASSLQVNGSTNLYARLNVNNSVGATITGDIATNSIHVYGGGIVTDSNSSLGGSTYATYLQIYNPGNNDPVAVVADAGHYARVAFNVLGVRLWTVGGGPDGFFYIQDNSAGVSRIWIETGGRVVIPSSGIYVAGAGTVVGDFNSGGTITSNAMLANYITANYDVHANNACYVGTAGYYFSYIGSGFLYTNGNFRVQSQLECYGNLVGNAALYVAGTGSFGGRCYVQDLWSFGNIFISNDENFYLGNSPQLKWLNFHPYRYFYWNRVDGSLNYSSGNTGSDGVLQLWIPYGGNWQVMAPNGPMVARGFQTIGLLRSDLQQDTLRAVENTNSIDIITKINPVHYRRPSLARLTHNVAEPYYYDEEPEEIGFLVEEIREALPQAVVELPNPSGINPDNDVETGGGTSLGLVSDAILAVAVGAIKELNERLTRLEAMVGA
jgi:cytoskeletal protein CcmA (bactofilin family)